MPRPTISWYGHSSFAIISFKQIVYIDPWKLPPDAPSADIILLTHEHFDHCSLEDIKSITSTHTRLVVPPACADKFSGSNAQVIRPGETVTINDIVIEAVPAYNIGKDFHPPDGQRVGYIVTVDGQRIYHAGDTDLIPEMDSIQCDVALVPISGTYVMTADEAAEAVKRIKPKVAVPMHYGSIIGTPDDVQRFQHLVPADVRVSVIPKTTSR